MKILLIYPNANRDILSWADTGAISEPIALEYIASVGLELKHEVQLLDLRLHTTELDSTLNAYQPDFVGITGYSMHVPRVLEIATTVKQYNPQCYVAVGGHHATLEPIDFQEPCVDFIVCSEGTVPFRKLLEQIENNTKNISVAGVYVRQNNDFIYGGEPLPFNIDNIPRPIRTLVPEDRQHYFIDWMKPIAMLRTSVGCPFRCSFCSLWRLMNGRYYMRNIEAVVEELATIPEKYVFLVDDEPFINADRMSKMAKKIKQAGIQKEYFSYCRIDSLLKHVDLLQEWKEVGLRRLIIGVETVFEDELEKYNKKYGTAQIIEALQNAKDIDIPLLCNFIVHPNYTQKRFDDLIRFIEENNVTHPSFTIWTPLPGTNYQDYDILYKNPKNGRPAWEYFDLQHPVIETTLPRSEFMKQFENLYQRFIAKYVQSQSPMTLDDLTKKQKILDETYAKIAAKILTFNKKE
ncbi:MAG: radical SAM protein [Planctomycetes bacterium]|nr:radical SAM protein [Planctomycetota bacterium]